MTMAYIRSKYGVPAKKGMQVMIGEKYGIIKGAWISGLLVLLDGDSKLTLHDPKHEIQYFDKMDNQEIIE